MVRQWQELFYHKRYSASQTGPSNPNFVKIAQGYGALSFEVTKKDQVTKTIQKALAHDGPVVMHFVVEPQENVYPMVPVGEAINNIIGGLA